MLLDPKAALAINLFRAVGISRILHTCVYAIAPVPQPSRLLAFLVTVCTTTYMAYEVARAAY